MTPVPSRAFALAAEIEAEGLKRLGPCFDVAFNQRWVFTSTRLDLQRMVGDIIANSAACACMTFEVKTVQQAYTKIFVEVGFKDHPEAMGWLYRSHGVDWLLYQFLANDSALLVSMGRLREWLMAKQRLSMYPLREAERRHGDNWTPLGRLVPIEDIVQMCGGVYYQSLPDLTDALTQLAEL